MSDSTTNSAQPVEDTDVIYVPSDSRVAMWNAMTRSFHALADENPAAAIPILLKFLQSDRRAPPPAYYNIHMYCLLAECYYDLDDFHKANAALNIAQDA
jgi:hypothetical protein